MKKVKRMMDGGVSARVPAAAAAGLARRPDMPVRPNMPDQSNAGGAMRGLERAAAMSGRTFPNAPVAPAPAVAPAAVPAVPPAPVAGVGMRPDVTGLARAAAMSGRAMPATGRPAGMKKGGSVSSASKRADGIAQRGKTKGRML